MPDRVLAALYGALSDDQKKQADQILTGMGCMMQRRRICRLGTPLSRCAGRDEELPPWLRGNNALNVFQVIVMVQATLTTLIEVVIFTWFALRLNKLSIQAIATHVG